ncbi:PDZ domain-containing protein [Puniceicoccales bacterium CK1056]|uniref:PDZ domain-containing protein n=1 Tax=Oceanipulchritudo coccoides TaxID=2706888 RepID=A0A6B2M3M0_9BACT|nr:trypsin-like peptidase domain-containing protein [Oceanipulchritudo coccoides]NDV63558.1 PDZ domain-containing protein [Oceanipulchritudo coccoides]
MTQLVKLVFAGFILLFIGGGCQSPTASSTAGFRNLLDSVVRLDVREASYTEGTRKMVRGVGSGVILDDDGYILTNAHVVGINAEEIIITLPNLERVEAELIGWDHWTDLALVKMDMESIKERGLSFSHGEFGESKALYPGQPVLAVGTPNGLTRTVTRGIISNPNRYFAASNQIGGYETGYFNTWLQTDAAINPGNSGGPLVDERGRIVGINTRSYLGSNNLSFAVPASIAMEILPQLKEQGRVTRSYIGLKPGALQDLESFYGIEANVGMLVDSIDPGSPAAEAGMRPGDIVLALDGHPLDVRFPEQIPPVLHEIAEYSIGETLTFTVLRNSREISVDVITEALESRVGERWAFEKWGISAEDVSKPYAREVQLDSDEGVLVTGVQQAFPAQQAGLNRGDIVLSINRENLDSLDAMKAFYDTYEENPEKVLFEVWRNHSLRYLVLEPR